MKVSKKDLDKFSKLTMDEKAIRCSTAIIDTSLQLLNNYGLDSSHYYNIDNSSILSYDDSNMMLHLGLLDDQINTDSFVGITLREIAKSIDDIYDFYEPIFREEMVSKEIDMDASTRNIIELRKILFNAIIPAHDDTIIVSHFRYGGFKNQIIVNPPRSIDCNYHFNIFDIKNNSKLSKNSKVKYYDSGGVLHTTHSYNGPAFIEDDILIIDDKKIPLKSITQIVDSSMKKATYNRHVSNGYVITDVEQIKSFF